MDVNEIEGQAIYETMSRLERRWIDGVPDNSVWHAYDSLPVALFLPTVREASELVSGRRFLDLGCGIGTKLALMRAMGWEVAGVERHEPYAVAARDLVPEAEIRLANISEVHELEADLIYMYRPAVSLEGEERLEEHVFEKARKGTLVFLPVRRDASWPGRVSADLWRV